MMISPEAYYDSELQGKTPEQIRRKIKSLRREITALKRTMENPDYTPLCCPSEDVRISCDRLYLERAKKALADMGVEYSPNLNERRAMAFDAAIEDIQEIRLEIGGFLSTWHTYTVYLEDPVRFEFLDTMLCPPIAEGPKEGYGLVRKLDFCNGFSTLHMGEWRKIYTCDRYGICIEDGTQWRVVITYRDGRKPFECSGSNAFPYNFKHFCCIIRAFGEPC